MHPAVSVIIPTKNEENNITRCLRSIRNQDYKGKIEIIVVDNYSKDKTAILARNFTSNIFIHGIERSSQRNFGAQKAKSDWLLFIDADMELQKNVITCVVELAINKSKSIIAIKEKAVGYTFITKALALEKNCYNNAHWLIAARLFPKTKFLQLGGYDETLISGEDWAITQNFRALNYTLLTTRHTYIIHHEPQIGLKELLRKEIYYIRHISRFADKYPITFSYQSSLIYRSSIWLESWRKLIPHPLLTLTFLTYKGLVWIIWKFNRSSVNT